MLHCYIIGIRYIITFSPLVVAASYSLCVPWHIHLLYPPELLHTSSPVLYPTIVFNLNFQVCNFFLWSMGRPLLLKSKSRRTSVLEIDTNLHGDSHIASGGVVKRAQGMNM